MILHFIFNTFIVFIVLALAVELFLTVFRVKNSRVRYVCRSLPFLKIPFDMIIFLTYGESLLINLNPFSCEIYVYELISKLFSVPMVLSEGEHLIIPQYIAQQMPPFWLGCLTVAVVLTACAGIGRKMIQLFSSKQHVRHIVSLSEPWKGTITNNQLQEHLLKLNAAILVSQEIEIPFAASPRYILLPESMLEELSQDELESVIAHELQHLRWRDPILKFFCSLTCALCWWIPAGWWLKRLVADQEQASDAGINAYGIDNHALASAIAKILFKAKDVKFDTTAMCLLGSSKSIHVDRLKHVLNEQEILQNSRFAFHTIFAVVLSLLAFMSLWMC